MIDGPASLITAQVRNGLLVRMAILYEILAGSERPRPVRSVDDEIGRIDPEGAPTIGEPA